MKQRVLCYRWVNANLRALFLLSLTIVLSATAQLAHARLEVCNKTDLVLMVAVGYDTSDERTASEGWWRVSPGFCEVPVDVALLKGQYYLHAESNPRSTMPNDSFFWGDETSLCVRSSDFRIPDSKQCKGEGTATKFSSLEKNWRNSNTIDISHGQRKYKDDFAAQVAGIQRLLSILGFDIGVVDGVVGKKTVAALNQVTLQKKVFGLDLRAIYPVLEELIAEQHKLDS